MPDTSPAAPLVRHFRQVLLWPLRVLPQTGAAAGRPPWQALRDLGPATPWREQVDEYTGPQQTFHERHYHEFVTFLPYVQRFLYGEGRAARDVDDEDGGAPMRVFRRRDVAAVRVLSGAGAAPVTLRVQHVDLYFFFDVDVVLLNVEVECDDLALDQAQELMYRFGRGYPPGWDDQGRPMHCLAEVDWLAADGRVLASSDAQQRDAFLAHVAEHRSPRLSAHWAWLLQPLVADHSGSEGALRLRHHRGRA